MLYGQQYNQAGSVLMIHIWAGVVVSVGFASSRWLLTENLQIFSTINTFIESAINILLNYIFITYVGIQ